MDKLFSEQTTHEAVTRVYVAPVVSGCEIKEVFPKERNDEISAVTNERVKQEKYSAWLLLEYALSDFLGLNTKDAELFRDENGKWHSQKCEFSISHSGSAVAVAISHAPVGIDIEPSDRVISEAFAKKFLTKDELAEYSVVEERDKSAFILTRWCIKEAVFKKNGNKNFYPSKTSDTNEFTLTKNLTLGEENYVLAIAQENKTDVSFYLTQIVL